LYAFGVSVMHATCTVSVVLSPWLVWSAVRWSCSRLLNEGSGGGKADTDESF